MLWYLPDGGCEDFYFESVRENGGNGGNSSLRSSSRALDSLSEAAYLIRAVVFMEENLYLWAG
jgi:hypothetical protein